MKSLFDKIKISATIGFLIVFLCSFQAQAAKTTSSIVIDAVTGEVLSSSNADERRYPASLTKLMTLYITFSALENGTLTMETPLKVSRNAANQIPSRINVIPGKDISVHDAIIALIVHSANDCAVVLAENISGSEKEFAELMTQTAQKLGMNQTTFKNASGLSNKQQKTTARDMAILGSAIYHHFPEHYDLFSTKTFSYNGHLFGTHNHLLGSFKGADGMKTGYLGAAGFNIVTSAQRDGKRVIAVTMGHNTRQQRDKKVSSLMEHGLKKLQKTPTSLNMAKLEIPSIATSSPDQDWIIQLGAFSNYLKARNYALEIQNRIHLPYISKTEIKIEPANNGAAIVYRAQLSGFAKNEADKTCYRLKKANKPCIVLENINQSKLVMVRK